MKLKGDINMTKAARSKAAPPPDLTKEQTAALIRLGGIDEFYPNMWEVQQAGEIFKAEMSRQKQHVASGDTSADVAIDIAASKVWSQARRYQSEKQAAQTAAEQTKPGGIKRLLRFLPNSRTKN